MEKNRRPAAELDSKPISPDRRAITALAFLTALVTEASNSKNTGVKEEKEFTFSKVELTEPVVPNSTDFMEQLVDLETDGYVIKFSGVNFVLDAAATLTSEQKDEIRIIQNSISGVGIIEDPLPPLESLQHKIETSPNNKDITVPIYQFTIHPDRQNFKVELKNILTGEKVAEALLDAPNSTEYDYDVLDTRRTQALDRLFKAMQRDEVRIATEYAHALKRHEVPAGAPDIMRIIPGNGLEQLSGLFDKDVYEIQLAGFKNGQHEEDERAIKWIINVNEKYEMPVSGSPEIPGTFTDLNLWRYKVDVAAPDWWTGVSSTIISTDKNGNIITVETSAQKLKGETDTTYTQNINVKVPEQFLPSTGDEKDAKGRSIDLTSVGLGEITDVVFDYPERITKVIETKSGNEFNFYFDGEDSSVSKIEDSQYEAIVVGIEEVQEAFFAEKNSAQLIKNVRVVHSSERNAYFCPWRPDTIAFTDDHLGEKSDNTMVISTARHETIHAVFNLLQLDNNPQLIDLYQELLGKDLLLLRFLSPEESFRIIAEGKWQGSNFGGHPKDNIDEFFTSFINSVFQEDLEKTMRSKLTPITAAKYAEAARTVREILSKALHVKNNNSQQVPILEKLAMAEKIATAMVSESKTISP
jgi:hypothetical protein